MKSSRVWAVVFTLAAVALSAVQAARADGWTAYGSDDAGTRYSTASEINHDNVGRLAVAWTYHTGEAARRGAAFAHGVFEATPILIEGKLLFCTPFNRLIALDPATGKELWTFDPAISLTVTPGNLFTCRGVAAWHDGKASAGSPCAARAFMTTNDARLFAVDVATGKPCAGFGKDGAAAQSPDIPPYFAGEYQITSPPTVAGDVVIVGSAFADTLRTRSPSGRITAFDARSGAVAWRFDPIPRNADDPAAATWEGGSWAETGGGEVWSTMSYDADRDLLFLPTADATATFYGGTHPGDNRYTDSVVALRASTGALVWQFQTVHHDIWDYDLAAQPTLTVIHKDGHDIPVVIEATKMGFVFVLDRETGKPIFPIEERPVPASDVPGERAAATEPVPVAPPPLLPQTLTPEDAWGIAYFDKRACAKKIAALRSEGLYTPPSFKGSILFPFTGGGVNWGSGAVDPERGVFITNTTRLAHVITLIPRADEAAAVKERPSVEQGKQLGTPYAMQREILLSPLGLPCNPPPWGMLTAVDLANGTIKWNAVLGTVPETVPIPLPLKFGTPNFGGPIVTKSGLVFIAAALDRYLRAFDAETGKELWKSKLPFGGQATPMTYEVGGRQFVVIAAGGYPRAGTKIGDAVVAFALSP